MKVLESVSWVCQPNWLLTWWYLFFCFFFNSDQIHKTSHEQWHKEGPNRIWALHHIFKRSWFSEISFSPEILALLLGYCFISAHPNWDDNATFVLHSILRSILVSYALHCINFLSYSEQVVLYFLLPTFVILGAMCKHLFSKLPW